MTLYKQLAGFLEIINTSSGSRHIDHNHVGDGETSAKESMMRRTLYCHFDIAAFLAAPCGRLKNYIAFFSQAN